jgi:hypothetical protein
MHLKTWEAFRVSVPIECLQKPKDTMSSPFHVPAGCPHYHSHYYYNFVTVVLKAVEMWTIRLILIP